MKTKLLIPLILLISCKRSEFTPTEFKITVPTCLLESFTHNNDSLIHFIEYDSVKNATGIYIMDASGKNYEQKFLFPKADSMVIVYYSTSTKTVYKIVNCNLNSQGFISLMAYNNGTIEEYSYNYKGQLIRYLEILPNSKNRAGYENEYINGNLKNKYNIGMGNGTDYKLLIQTQTFNTKEKNNFTLANAWIYRTGLDSENYPDSLFYLFGGDTIAYKYAFTNSNLTKKTYTSTGAVKNTYTTNYKWKCN